jgi:hypothetical protein
MNQHNPATRNQSSQQNQLEIQRAQLKRGQFSSRVTSTYRYQCTRAVPASGQFNKQIGQEASKQITTRNQPSNNMQCISTE